MSWANFLEAFQVKMLNKDNIKYKVQNRIILTEDLEDPDIIASPISGKYPFIGIISEDVAPDYEERQHLTEDFQILVAVYHQRFPHDPQSRLKGPLGVYAISEAITADEAEGGMNNDIDYTYDGPDIVELHWTNTQKPRRVRNEKHANMIVQVSTFQVIRDTVFMRSLA